MTVVVSSASLEYVRVRVSAVAAGAPINPTTDVVQMAFKQAGAEPSLGDWKTGDWETDATTSPPTYIARCLVGPGGTVTLADGQYTVWLKITDTPETPIRPIGLLAVS